MTALEAIKVSKPVLIFDSEHNRESSALPYLNSVRNSESPSGIFSIESPESIFNSLEKVLSDPKMKSAIVKNQSKVPCQARGTAASFC